MITELDSYKSQQGKQTTFQPITISFKTALIKHKGIIPDISFLGNLTLFSKDDNDRKRSAPEFKFLFDHELSKSLNIGYNLGMKWDNNLSENYTYTFTVAKAITPKINAFLEAYGFISPIFKADHRLDTGFTYFINNNSAVDISAGKGLSDISPDYFVSFGYSFRINLSK